MVSSRFSEGVTAEQSQTITFTTVDTIYTRPIQDQAGPNSSMEKGIEYKVQPLPEELLVIVTTASGRVSFS